MRLIVWCRARQEDILAAKATGSRAIHISFPASPLLQELCHTSYTKTIADIAALVELAKIYFSYVSVGFQDASRMPQAQLADYVAAAVRVKVQRIRIADTVGILTPEKTRELISFVKALTPRTELEFHAHNDYGLATINTLTALQAGATAVSVTVNGLGERAGNAAFEEVVVGLEHRYAIRTSIDLHMLVPLSAHVVRMTGWKTARTKAVTGKNIFRHTAGVHCYGLLQNVESYQPFDPVIVGHPGTEIVLGAHSGKTATHAYIEQKSFSLPKLLGERILTALAKLSFLPRFRFLIRQPD
jgi:homocitrate synthase NifV